MIFECKECGEEVQRSGYCEKHKQIGEKLKKELFEKLKESE